MNFSFSEILESERLKRGLSPEKLASLLEIPVSTLSRWERDVTQPRNHQLQAIATIFNISVDELVSPTGMPTYLACNFKHGKIPFTMRKANGPTPAISLPLLTAALSFTKAIALIQEQYTP